MKYRKKPVEIEAVQFTEDMLLERQPVAPGLTIVAKSWHPNGGVVHSYKAGVDTLEGFMEARVGDWIICGVKGEYYPCKPDIFAMTYEPAQPTIADLEAILAKPEDKTPIRIDPDGRVVRL